jgi:acetylornithine deacetylase/succinyl-diaminopimelate desuccinylase-like protein
VNVRFCCDGEEEVGGASIVEFLGEHASSPAACVIFDTPMLDRETHVFTTATRGTLYMHLEVGTGRRDLHSGIYGGAALNAVHVLVRALGNLHPSAVSSGRFTSRPAGHRARGVRAPARQSSCAQGSADARASRGSTRERGSGPRLMNGQQSAFQPKTIVVAEARANLSMRLAAGQTGAALFPRRRLVRRGLPASVRLELTELASCDQDGSRPTFRPFASPRRVRARARLWRPLLLRAVSCRSCRCSSGWGFPGS